MQLCKSCKAREARQPIPSCLQCGPVLSRFKMAYPNRTLVISCSNHEQLLDFQRENYMCKFCGAWFCEACKFDVIVYGCEALGEYSCRKCAKYKTWSDVKCSETQCHLYGCKCLNQVHEDVFLHAWESLETAWSSTQTCLITNDDQIINVATRALIGYAVTKKIPSTMTEALRNRRRVAMGVKIARTIWPVSTSDDAYVNLLLNRLERVWKRHTPATCQTVLQCKACWK